MTIHQRAPSRISPPKSMFSGHIGTFLLVTFLGRRFFSSSSPVRAPFVCRRASPTKESFGPARWARLRLVEPTPVRGLDEDMILHREIGGFSAGQKSKLTLGAAFWTTLRRFQKNRGRRSCFVFGGGALASFFWGGWGGGGTCE